VLFVGFSRIFLLGILIFKGLTARRLYKPFGVKGLINLNFKGFQAHSTRAQSDITDAMRFIIQSLITVGLMLV
jgi:hypothetical protein